MILKQISIINVASVCLYQLLLLLSTSGLCLVRFSWGFVLSVGVLFFPFLLHNVYPHPLYIPLPRPPRPSADGPTAHGGGGGPLRFGRPPQAPRTAPGPTAAAAVAHCGSGGSPRNPAEGPTPLRFSSDLIYWVVFEVILRCRTQF